jgi:hypothetical protein
MYPHARDLGVSWRLGVSTFLPVITEDGYHEVMVGFSPHSRARSPGHDARGKACLCDVHPIALTKIPVRIDADVLLQLSWRGVASSPGAPSSRPAVAAKRKRSYGVGCWIAEVSSRTVRCLPMTWATSLNPVGPQGSNQSDTEFHGVCTELRGAEFIIGSDRNSIPRAYVTKGTNPCSARHA